MLLIRADADAQMGAGHVMRCLALAQVWSGPVRFICRQPPEWLAQRLAREGFGLSEEEDFSGAEWVLVDGYHFSADYLRAIPAPVVFFDDVPRLPEYPVALVWNPNLGARPAYGSTPALLGPTWYPLRREFWDPPPQRLEPPQRARRIVISMGGADPDGYTATALEAVRALPQVEVRVIVGGSNRRRAELARRLAPSELVGGAADLRPVLAWADLAVSAAGVTAYELAFLGVPTVLVTLADNQVPGAQGFAAAQAAVNLGPTPPVEVLRPVLAELAADPSRRQALAAAARRLVDGRGARRVAARLRGDPDASCELLQRE